MKRSLPLFGIDLVHDEAMGGVLVKHGERIIDFHRATDRKHAKKVMSRIENDFHNIARGMEVA